jgi:hypothetical protein
MIELRFLVFVSAFIFHETVQKKIKKKFYKGKKSIINVNNFIFNSKPVANCMFF